MNKRGFTIVELLIAIVVIAILASISVVAYTGVQDRARNTQRLHDAATITKALEIYKAQNNSYPPTNSSGQNSGDGGWEVSSTNPGTFLQALRTSGIISSVPVDPVNVGGNLLATGSKVYMYYLYPAGHGGCDATKGPFYIFMIYGSDGGAGRATSAPGFTCVGQHWNWGYYSSGGYTN